MLIVRFTFGRIFQFKFVNFFGVLQICGLILSLHHTVCLELLTN